MEGPPLWVGSWGSDAGLRRVARLGDGWLASAYNTTPAMFEAAWHKLRRRLAAVGRDPQPFPNALATMFLYITEDRREAERLLAEVIGPTLNRPIVDLRERLLIGPAEACAAKLEAYQAAGLQRVFLWPVADEANQLIQFQQRVIPLMREYV
jgi:alkanesulfonate monooxygenase SsuD/methylene tetrahydromethanopterin reductase-like flavin-dependent oxidoreductase (luciferase family)